MEVIDDGLTIKGGGNDRNFNKTIVDEDDGVECGLMDAFTPIRPVGLHL